VDPGETEESPSVVRNACENQLVPIDFCAPVRVDQHVNPGAVDELESSQVERDPSSQPFCVPQFSVKVESRR
jgi:hypothetical protein